MDATADMSFDEFYNAIKYFLDGGIIEDKDIVKERRKVSRGFMANRLITGKAAEEYFVMNYQGIDVFHDFAIQDTTQMGCGFDFKLTLAQKHFYVEVKGINEKTGSVLMTEKEHSVADDLRDLYCLFVVSNFRETPEHHIFFNPLYIPQLEFKRQEQIIESTLSTKNQINAHTAEITAQMLEGLQKNIQQIEASTTNENLILTSNSNSQLSLPA